MMTPPTTPIADDLLAQQQLSVSSQSELSDLSRQVCIVVVVVVIVVSVV